MLEDEFIRVLFRVSRGAFRKFARLNHHHYLVNLSISQAGVKGLGQFGKENPVSQRLFERFDGWQGFLDDSFHPSIIFRVRNVNASIQQGG